MNDSRGFTKTHTEIELNSSLNCLRRNTVIIDRKLGHFEHIAIWVPEYLKEATTSLAGRPPGGIHGGDLAAVQAC